MKRRNNLLYCLRRKGITCDTKNRTIYYSSTQGDPRRIKQIESLITEYGFILQYIIQ